MNAWFVPFAGHYHHSADHGRNTGGVSNSLGANFFVAFFMVADVVEVVGFVLAVFFAAEDAADVGFALGAWT